MARVGGGNVFKSASAGVLRPIGARGLGGAKEIEDDRDPLMAVLNHAWDRKPKEDEKKRGLGLARSRPQQDPSSGATKASEKGKALEEGRNRLGQAGGLFVDTGGGAAKNRLAPSFEEAPAGEGESPPVSPGDTSKTPGTRRGGAKAAPAPPARRLHYNVCPETDQSPRLLPPPKIRKGQIKLDFEKAGEEGDAEHAQCEVDDHRPHLDKEQEHFVDLVHHFHGAVNQAGVRLNEMLLKVRKHFLEDAKWLEDKMNFDQLTEVSFEVQTVNYFLAKWHHELEPRKAPVPAKPSKIEDMSADDILAQTLYSVSRMEVLACKLAPVLEKICHDAKTMRRGPNGEPLTPRSKNALTLAQKRGFQDTDEFNRLLGHMEHILSVAQHLATPPTNGLPMRETKTIIKAAEKFKMGLFKKKKGVDPASPKGAPSPKGGPDSPKLPVKNAFSGAANILSSKIDEKHAEAPKPESGG
jgi:hypothetical protein